MPAQVYPTRGNSFFDCPGGAPTAVRKKNIFLIVSLEWTLLYNLSALRWLVFLISTKAFYEEMMALKITEILEPPGVLSEGRYHKHCLDLGLEANQKVT